MPTKSDRELHMDISVIMVKSAFYASRGIGPATPETRLAAAIEDCARISETDQSGADLDDVMQIAFAQLVASDFRTEAVALFLDDVKVAAVHMAQDRRGRVL